MATLQITATLEPHGPAGAFVLTDDQVAEVGGGKKVFPVAVTVNGITARLRLARMGGLNMIGLARAARQQLGVELGSEYAVTIALDEAERTVEVPDDLRAALATDPAAGEAFDKLSFTHRKEYVRWVTEAKKEQTRSTRIAKTLEMLVAGQTR